MNNLGKNEEKNYFSNQKNERRHILKNKLLYFAFMFYYNFSLYFHFSLFSLSFD